MRNNQFKFSQRSLNNMQMLHPHLVSVLHLAITITPIDFVVIETLRDMARQRQLYESGASRTMDSLHLRQKSGLAHAYDLGAWIGGVIRWDWPLYETLAVAQKQAAKDLGIPLEWGGDWTTFRDGPHFQLPRNYRG